MTVLQWGNPPDRDKCKDAGEIPVPKIFDMPTTAQLQQLEIGASNLWGQKMPVRARVRHAVFYLNKNYPGANVCGRVKDLGMVRVGPDGWAVD